MLVGIRMNGATFDVNFDFFALLNRCCSCAAINRVIFDILNQKEIVERFKRINKQTYKLLFYRVEVVKTLKLLYFFIRKI